MKQTILLFSALILVLLAFNSCKKDQIDVNELSGKWMVKSDVHPAAVDVIVYYTFEDNGSFTEKYIDYLENKTRTSKGTYELSDNNTIITLHSVGFSEPKKRRILKFDKNYMKWVDENDKLYYELNKVE